MNGPHTVIPFGGWTISREGVPQAPPDGYTMECRICKKDSGLRFDSEGACDWAATHVDQNPTHTAFHEALGRYWRAIRK
ncbi:DUF7848 domain-containing protein [Streptomyces abikoensis]